MCVWCVCVCVCMCVCVCVCVCLSVWLFVVCVVCFLSGRTNASIVLFSNSLSLPLSLSLSLSLFLSDSIVLSSSALASTFYFSNGRLKLKLELIGDCKYLSSFGSRQLGYSVRLSTLSHLRSSSDFRRCIDMKASPCSSHSVLAHSVCKVSLSVCLHAEHREIQREKQRIT